MKLIYIVAAFIIVSGIGFVAYTQSKSKPQQPPTIPLNTTPPPTPTNQPVNYQAGFAIFTNGTFRVFEAPMYHNLSKDVYIEASNPNIIHVKKPRLTYDDFFKTLPFKLTKQCLTTGTKQTFCTGSSSSLKFYLNEVKTDDLLNREIGQGDQILISYGPINDAQIQNQLTQIPKP